MEAGLLERIQRLKLNEVLPNKLKFLLKVYARSDDSEYVNKWHRPYGAHHRTS